MAALGTFTAGIAHELNNPLNNILLTGEAFSEDYGASLDPEGAEMLSDILSQAERAGDIVRNLLDFARTERPAFSALSAEEVVQSTLALLRNQIMLSGVRLETELPPGLPKMRANLRNLQQVFMNLLLNAMQATPAGGRLHFGASSDAAGFIRFEVRDTGRGIDAEILPHIFEPFYTTKEVGRGTGLGLAVAYSIVNRHGGRIEVQSESGQGSVFWVYIPWEKDGSTG
jgi:signal transduction histidine kinase